MKPWITMTMTAVALAALAHTAAAAPQTLMLADSFEAGDPGDFESVFGATELVPSGGLLPSAALAFNTAGNDQLVYDQIRYTTFSEGYAPRRVSLSFDLLTVDLVGSNNQFVVLFDTPEIRNLMFTPEGNIEVLNPGTGASGVIGVFEDRQLVEVDLVMDLAADSWEISIGGVSLYSDTVSADFVLSVRMSHGAVSGAVGGDVVATSFIDNVVIAADDFVEIPAPVPVPAPAAIWTMAAGLAALAARRRVAASFS